MREDHLLVAGPDDQLARNLSRNPLLRDMVAVAFRHRRLLLTTFFAVLVGAVLVVAIIPKTYQSSLKILVRNERADPVVSSAPEANQAPTILPITEEQLNSEVELIKAEDVLRKVVLENGLTPRKSRLPWGPHSNEERMATAVRGFRMGLDAGPMPRSNLIEVKYESTNPQLAARVLNTLGELYLQKHMEVRGTSGQYAFFTQEAERYRKIMDDAEAKLSEAGPTAPELARNLTVQKLKDSEEALQQTAALIAETQRRLTALEQQKATTPPRMTTQTRKSDNQALLQNLKSTLLTLQLKRTELLTKFQPTYRPVQELEQQIAETEKAITAEENAPARDETTDQNPVNQWESSEIAKATADLAGLQARSTALERTISDYNQRAQALNQDSIKYQDMARTAKTAEDNYLLYTHKSEEARIDDTLDQKRILNVAIAESAHVPALPVTPTSLRLLLSVALAFLVSVITVAAAEFFDPTFRTPAEVAGALAPPLLVSLPRLLTQESAPRYLADPSHNPLG
jgi:uncharacterized protein involved in exopolysaccharide biosynthesis